MINPCSCSERIFLTRGVVESVAHEKLPYAIILQTKLKEDDPFGPRFEMPQSNRDQENGPKDRDGEESSL